MAISIINFSSPHILQALHKKFTIVALSFSTFSVWWSWWSSLLKFCKKFFGFLGILAPSTSFITRWILKNKILILNWFEICLDKWTMWYGSIVSFHCLRVSISQTQELQKPSYKCRWLGRAMVLGSFQCWGLLLLWHMVGQGTAVLAASAEWVGCFFVVFTEILWSQPL